MRKITSTVITEITYLLLEKSEKRIGAVRKYAGVAVSENLMIVE